MYSYKLLKMKRKSKGSVTIQILIIFFLIMFLITILFKLSLYRVQKADMEKEIIENSVK